MHLIYSYYILATKIRWPLEVSIPIGWTSGAIQNFAAQIWHAYIDQGMGNLWIAMNELNAESKNHRGHTNHAKD